MNRKLSGVWSHFTAIENTTFANVNIHTKQVQPI